MSGFTVPKKHGQKANDYIGSTSKPDRITEGQRGWNQEPVFYHCSRAAAIRQRRRGHTIATTLQLSCSAVAEKPPCQATDKGRLTRSKMPFASLNTPRQLQRPAEQTESLTCCQLALVPESI